MARRTLRQNAGKPNQRMTFDRHTGAVVNTPLEVAPNAQGSSSGDVVPVNTAFDAAAFVAEEGKMHERIAAIDAQLNEVTYDPRTGAPSPKLPIGSRVRDLKTAERNQFINEIALIRAQDVLPKVGAAKEAQQAKLQADAKRARDIQTLSQTLDSNGRRIGHAAAVKLIDEANQRAMADRLVRGA